jgi:hypothetical protein
VYRIEKLKSGKGPAKGYRAIDDDNDDDDDNNNKINASTFGGSDKTTAFFLRRCGLLRHTHSE